MQNQEDSIKLITQEIKAIVQSLQQLTTYNSVVSNFHLITSLYEKSVAIKNWNEHRLSFSPSKEDQHNELEQDDTKKWNELESLKQQLTAITLQNDSILKILKIQKLEPALSIQQIPENEPENGQLNQIILKESLVEDTIEEDSQRNQETILDQETPIPLNVVQENNQEIVQENSLEERIENEFIEELQPEIDATNELEEELSDNNTQDKEVEIEEEEVENKVIKSLSLKLNLAKLKNQFSIPEENIASQEQKEIEKFSFSNDEKSYYIKELFDNRYEDWDKTILHLTEIPQIEKASEYLSELYYSKKWSKKEVIAQAFWKKIENAY